MNKSLSRAYHYTSQSLAMFISQSHELKPQRPFIITERMCELPVAAYLPSIWAFKEKIPREWTESKEFEFVWRRIITHTHHSDPVLMRLDWEILPEDKAHVLDWAHMERVREQMLRGQMGLSIEGDIGKINQAAKRYFESRVPVQKYTKGYTLPELVFDKPVPLNRITTHEIMFEPNLRTFVYEEPTNYW